jgi:hypothetical protein
MEQLVFDNCLFANLNDNTTNYNINLLLSSCSIVSFIYNERNISVGPIVFISVAFLSANIKRYLINATNDDPTDELTRKKGERSKNL